jgi:hypothetical protein
LILFSDEVEKFYPAAQGSKHVLRVIREVLFFEPQTARHRSERRAGVSAPGYSASGNRGGNFGFHRLSCGIRKASRKLRPQMMLLESLAQALFCHAAASQSQA